MRTRFTHFQALSARVQAEGRNHVRGGLWRLRISAGEEVPLYFTGKGGDGGEPHYFYTHWIGAAKSSEVCGKVVVYGEEDGPIERGECVLCEAIAAGDKSIGKRMLRCAYNVVIAQKQHKVAEKTYELCTAEERRGCKHCHTGSVAQPKGARKAEWSFSDAQRLHAQIEALESKCAGCLAGKVSADVFECDQCGEEVRVTNDASDLDIQREMWRTKCGKCGTVGQFTEFVACNRCDNGRRARFFGGHVLVKVQRGTGPKDGCTFIVDWPPENARPNWLDEEKFQPHDLAVEYAPRPASDICRHYNIPNHLQDRYPRDTPWAAAPDDAAAHAHQPRRSPSPDEAVDYDDDVPF